jgi:histone H3/H4
MNETERGDSPQGSSPKKQWEYMESNVSGPAEKPVIPDLASAEADTGESRRHIQEVLEGHSFPAHVSEQALQKLRVLPVQYFEDLLSAASRIARRNGSDVISASDVEAADRTLQSRPHRLLWITINTVGGLLGGAGLSQILQVLSAKDKPSVLALIFAIVPTVIGFVMMAISIPRGSLE